MHENFQYASPLADGAEAGVSRWGMRIASLHSYPVKGGRRLDHDEAGVEPHGLAGDRRWMIVDDRGVGITQREVPRLSRLQARSPGSARTSWSPARRRGPRTSGWAGGCGSAR
jgi:uncharacterized protein YcbX